MIEVQQPPAGSGELVAILPPDQAQEILTAQVEATRQRDNVSRLSQLSLGAAGVQGVIAGAMIGEALSAGLYNAEEITVGATVAVGTMLWSGTRHAVDKKIVRAHIERDNRASVPTGQEYELFRTGHRRGRRKVTMLWYGPIPQTEGEQPGVIESLQTTARMAQKAGVDRLLVAESLLMGKLPETPEPYGSMQRWLDRNKQRVVTGGAKKDVVYSEEPKEWERLAEAAKLSSGGVIMELLSKLGQIAPNHILLRRMAESKASGKTMTPQQLANAIRADLPRFFDDVEAIPGVDLRRPPSTWTTNRKRDKGYVRGVPFGYGEWVSRMINGKNEGMATMRSMLGLSDRHITDLIAQPSNDPQRAEPAIELSLLRESEQLDRPDLTELSHQHSGAAQRTRTTHYQEQFAGHPPTPNQLRTRRYRQWLGRIAVTALVGIGAGLATHAEHNHLEHVEEGAYTKLDHQAARSAGVAPNDFTSPALDSTRLEHEVDAQYPLVGAMDLADTLTNTAINVVAGPLGLETNPYVLCFGSCPELLPPSANINSGVGNARDGFANQVQWHLAPHNERTNGYWPEYTSHQLQANGGRYQAPEEQWIPDETIIGEQSLPVDLPQDRPRQDIAVSRELTSGDSAGTYQGGSYIETPILENNRIIAAHLTQNRQEIPLKLLSQAGGTEALRLPPNIGSSGELSYYITPGHAAVHAVAAVNTEGTMPVEPATIAAEFGLLDPNWAHQTPSERAGSIANYISSQFRYALDPEWPGEFLGDRSLAQVILKELVVRKANCNVANTITSFTDPELNPAIGYNNGDGLDSLNSHDTHLYLVDRNGNPLDATPTSVTSADQGYFAPPTSNPTPPLWPWELGLGTAIVGTGAFWQRKRLANLSNAARTDLATRLTVHMPADSKKLSLAIELASASYASELDVTAAIRRTTQKHDYATMGTVALIVRRPDLHHPATSWQILQASRKHSGYTGHLLRQSAATLALAHLAYRLLPPELRQPLSK